MTQVIQQHGCPNEFCERWSTLGNFYEIIHCLCTLERTNTTGLMAFFANLGFIEFRQETNLDCLHNQALYVPTQGVNLRILLPDHVTANAQWEMGTSGNFKHPQFVACHLSRFLNVKKSN